MLDIGALRCERCLRLSFCEVTLKIQATQVLLTSLSQALALYMTQPGLGQVVIGSWTGLGHRLFPVSRMGPRLAHSLPRSVQGAWQLFPVS